MRCVQAECCSDNGISCFIMLDLDWRHVKRAKELGVTIAIGPDAHSPRALDWTDLGVAMARKGWLEAADVLNTRDATFVTKFARRRK